MLGGGEEYDHRIEALRQTRLTVPIANGSDGDVGNLIRPHRKVCVCPVKFNFEFDVSAVWLSSAWLPFTVRTTAVPTVA